ncbi:type II secretion system protein M [Niveibacterium sp. 24ML]|uniref:type II secretion system protein GspM n=1 Tax=Niveibacterium sp. 24ML TaxID=2985512 RepID=UPI00226F1CA4|nr:type II secretion system protein GspM [Niveibacterium sp. 24ML]MCX9155082.1 type II secretion system protein M [Niveibacterium sp. 24ML]
MKARWIALSDRFNAMADRERILLCAAAIGVLLGLFWFLLIEPAMNRQAAALAQVQTLRKQLDGLAEQAALLDEARRNDPDLLARQQIERLIKENLELKAALSSKRALLADPREVPARLRDLLAAQPGLELVSLTSLPVQNLMASDPLAAAPPPGAVQSAPLSDTVPSTAVYRHGLTIAVRGDYATVSKWLRTVEQLGWQVFWGKLHYEVDRYPQAVATVTIYSLSLDAAWLRL